MSNNKKTKISIIIPVYNAAKYINECLESVISQDLTEWEALCIDDGSTDNSLAIIKGWAEKDRRIKVHSHENHGAGYSRNKGIKLASGEFLFFLDADDWIHDEAVLSDLYNAAKENDVYVCGGTFEAVYGEKRISLWSGEQAKYTFDEDKMWDYRDFQFDYGWVRFIYDREFILKNDLKIPEYSFFEDPVFFVKTMAKAEKFYALKRIVYCYRDAYKEREFNRQEVEDLLKGIREIVLLSQNMNYEELVALEKRRLEKEYGSRIAGQLVRCESEDAVRMLDELNEIMYPDGRGRLEYRMFEDVVQKKDKEIRKLKNEKKKITSSLSWKVGRAGTYLPRAIKRSLKSVKKTGL